jgi:UDP-N-acetylmuramate--alanine ligase
MHQTFYDYAKQVQNTLYYKYDLPLASSHNKEIALCSYGIEAGGARAVNIRAEAPYFVFDWEDGEDCINELKFTLPVNHNVLNATAAIAIAKKLGCKAEGIRAALLSFKGIKRRFEFRIDTKAQVYIDDYAHHPEELKAAIQAAKTLYPTRKITGVFQPHLFSRTKDFAAGFAAALDLLDAVVLLDIYPARELPMEGVSSAIIFDKMKQNNKVLIKKEALLEELKTRDLEVLMTLGAGDIGALVPDIAEMLAKCS